MPPHPLTIPPHLVVGDLVSVKWEQKFDLKSKGVMYDWKGVVEGLQPLRVRFDAEEKLGQKNPDEIPFVGEGCITHDVRRIVPKRPKDFVLARPTDTTTQRKDARAATRRLRVFHSKDGWVDVDAEWTTAILEAHTAFMTTPGAPEVIEVNHCGVRVPVNVKTRTIGHLRQILEFGPLSSEETECSEYPRPNPKEKESLVKGE